MAITNQDEFNQTVSMALSEVYVLSANNDRPADEHIALLTMLDDIDDYAYRDEPVVLHAGP